VARTQARKLERWSPPVAALAVFAVFVAVCGVQLGSPGLTEPDEARYAAVGQSMWQSRDFITPRFNGFVYLDKPPLLHWLTALSIGLFGPRESAVRLSCLLAAGAGVALTYAFGRRVYGHQAGLAAA
jgi:4-amino-4-deoxy-L-arabinose transferase-like glycosyltransferase